MKFRKILVRIVQLLPGRVVNWAGAAQFQYPLLAPLIRKVGGAIRNGEAVISAGVAKGLRINGEHGFPGYVLGTTEPEQQIWLSEHVREGDVVYDIGANIGFFALLCGKLTGEIGQIEAFEPNPICANACRRNMNLNGFSHVQVHEIALSNSEGNVSFTFPEHSTALGKIAKNESQGEEGPAFAVRTATLDNYISGNNLRPPNLLIIDVEGHEIEVLKGAHNTIKEYRPIINCEVHWLGDAFIKYFKEMLQPLGYQLENITRQPIPKVPERWQAILNAKLEK
jgi:FkbM family methyltransferase